MAKGFKIVGKDARVMLTENVQTEASLVTGQWKPYKILYSEIVANKTTIFISC